MVADALSRRADLVEEAYDTRSTSIGERGKEFLLDEEVWEELKLIADRDDENGDDEEHIKQLNVLQEMKGIKKSLMMRNLGWR